MRFQLASATFRPAKAIVDFGAYLTGAPAGATTKPHRRDKKNSLGEQGVCKCPRPAPVPPGRNDRQSSLMSVSAAYFLGVFQNLVDFTNLFPGFIVYRIVFVDLLELGPGLPILARLHEIDAANKAADRYL